MTNFKLSGALALIILSILAVPIHAVTTVVVQTDLLVDVEEWEATCVGDVIVHNVTYTETVDGVPTVTILAQNYTCEHGCSTDLQGNTGCKQSAVTYNVVIAIIVLFVVFFALFLLSRISR